MWSAGSQKAQYQSIRQFITFVHYHSYPQKFFTSPPSSFFLYLILHTIVTSPLLIYACTHTSLHSFIHFKFWFMYTHFSQFIRNVGLLTISIFSLLHLSNTIKTHYTLLSPTFPLLHTEILHLLPPFFSLFSPHQLGFLYFSFPFSHQFISPSSSTEGSSWFKPNIL